MSKITVLGSCSGTEPFENTHHCSLLFETEDSLYWFDCGEGAAYNAFVSGKDVLKTRAVFISHPHFDHIGSLSHLLFIIQKMYSKHKKKLFFGDSIDFYLPDPSILEPIKHIAMSTRSETMRFSALPHTVSDGLVYSDENIKVTACHNSHLKEDGTKGWHSYSYLIETYGKRIVFSGDVGSPYELDPLIAEGCDILIAETGHHKVSDILKYAESRNIGKLYFNHHGREILNGRAEAQKLLDASPQTSELCRDGTEIVL